MIKYKYVAQKEVRPIYMYSFKLNPFDILKKKKKLNFNLKYFPAQTTRNLTREESQPPEAYTVQASKRE